MISDPLAALTVMALNHVKAFTPYEQRYLIIPLESVLYSIVCSKQDDTSNVIGNL